MRWKDQGEAVCGRGNSDQKTTAMAVAGNGGQSRGSTRADDSQPKSGSNSSRNGAGGGRDGGSRGSGSGNGDGGNGCNGGDNAPAMAAVMAMPTWPQQWQRLRGRTMWVEVIIKVTYYDNICITVGYVWYRCETIVRHMAKHKSVLREQAQQKKIKKVF